MALLNENRMRIPQVATLPGDGDDGGIRGQMRMTADVVDGIIEVCVRSDERTVSKLIVVGTGGEANYTSVAVGDAGELVSVEHAFGGTPTPVVTVIGNAILVTGDITTTNDDVKIAIDASAEASALVTVTSTGGTLLVVGAAFLAGGAGDKAVLTPVLTDLTFTAVKSGSAGNDISVEVVDGGAGANLVVVVSGTDIVITGDAAHDTTDIQNAVNGSSLASRLVVASGGGATSLADEAAANLTGGASTALWLTLTAQ